MKEAYKRHRVGSNKGVVHALFDGQGPEKAIKKAVALGLQETTARTWISSWRSKTKAPAKKSPAKKGPAKKTRRVAA